MDAQGIRHGAPTPFRSMQPDGSFTTRWTTVALPDVSNDDVEIFLCQFGDDLPARRLRTLEQLRSGDGGPLSVQSIKEIVYGASDVKRMQLHWRKLLNPRQELSPGVWQVGAGPALRLIQADKDGIQGLAVEFYKLAFGAVEVYRVEDPGGSLVSRFSVDGAEFWLSDESPEHGNFSPESLGGGTARMILTVPDPDAVFAKSIAAGAREVFPVDEAHGWRLGRVVDPFGHHWEIGRELAS